MFHPESFDYWSYAMKRILIGATAIASLLTTSALAADLAAKVYTKAPPPVVAVYDWTGFYIGGNVGYSWGRSSTTQAFSDATTGTLLSGAATKFDLNGVIGGGQIGYNWQRDRWVFGLEADIQGSGEKGSTNAVCPGGPAVVTTNSAAGVNGLCSQGHVGDTLIGAVGAFPVTNSLSEKIEWFGTVRGRIGPTVTPTILAYVTGGLAYGSVKATDTVSGTNVTNPGGQGVNGGTVLTPVNGAFGGSSTRVGWTVGAGLEGAIGGNWTAKIEYLYIDLGNISGSFVTPIIAPSGNFVTASYNSHITDNVLRVGVNYKFAGPIVAKY
jgi:outer membrane immunogenic protein